MNKGMNQIAENCSYLRAQFFEEHPTEKPVKAKALDIDRRSSLMMSESGSFGTLDLQGSDSFQRVDEKDIEEDENAEVDDDERSLEQVCIHMMQADWLTSTEEGRKLLEVMSTSPDCLRLFESKTTQIFTNYMWDQTRGYFIIYYFMPFIILGFLPLMTMSFMMRQVESPEKTPGAFTVFYISVLFLALGTVLQVYTELQEIRNVNRGGPKRYFKDLQNIFQWGMIAINVALIFQAFAIAGLV